MDFHFRQHPTFLVSPSTVEREKTVVVLGAFRGGTSMIAQILRELGVYMGAEFAAPDPEYDTVEDKKFQKLLHRNDLLCREEIEPTDFTPEEIDSLRKLIEQRNREHPLWGWKYPGTVVWCLHAGLERYLRNPHFITVFRDPLAVFQHEVDKHRMDPAAIRHPSGRSLRWVMLQNQRLMEHVLKTDAPHLLVSYERSISGGEAAKRDLIDSISQFLRPV